MKKNYSKICFLNSTKLSATIRFLSIVLFISFFGNVMSAQTNTYTGNSGGNWNTALNWSLGLVPTSSHDAVIPIGKTVIVNAGVNAKSITISGIFSIVNNVDININSQLIVVTSTGQIMFAVKSIIRLPSNVALYLQNGSDSLSGSCNNNDEIFVGTVRYAVCKGGGAAYLFEEIVEAGGINNVVTSGAIGTSQSICNGSTPTPLTSMAAGLGSGTITYEWQTNTSGSYVTISGATSSTYSPPILTTTTSFKRRTVSVVGTNASYSAYTTPVTITVTSNNTAGVASSTPTLCINTVLTNISHATTGATGIGAATNLPVGVSAVWSSNMITISGTPTTSGTFNYSIPLTGGCGTVNATGTITVNILPTAPSFAAADITQPNCVVTTGSIGLSDLPTSDPWTIIANPNTAGLTGLTGSGSTATIGGLTQGTSYTFSVSNGICTSIPTAIVMVDIVETTNSSDGVNWTSPPTISKIGVITASSITPISISAETELCSCTVSANTNLVVNSGITLKLQDRLTVNGSLTFEDKSSLLQINDAAVNTGNIIYNRITNTGVRNTDYTYWSTPVSPLNLGGTGGILYNPSNLVGSIFYSYEVTAGYEDWKSESAASPMIIGKGYSIRGPGPISANPLTLLGATFTGTPNNGRYPIIGIHPDKAYLIGNPYPSALDANKFLTDNAGVIDGTLYFWTHSTKIGIGVPNPGTGVYAYTGNDYASYNLTGGTGTDNVAYPQGGVEAPNSPGVKPNGYIGAGQGFFAISNTAILGVNEIVFNNSMRVGVGGITGDNSQFFKTNSTKSKTTSTIEKNRVWLNMTSTQGAFKQLLVGYITGATNDYDNGYDGETFDGNEFIDFYSINQDKNFVIQGRSLPFDSNDEVPLGYRSAAAGDFSISIDEVDGLLIGQNIYLEDKLNNTIHNLTKKAYNFETAKGTFDDRFVLRYTDKTLGVGDFETTEKQVLVSVKNKQLKINSSVESIDKVFIYDVLGKQLYEKINVENKELIISNLGSSEQVLIVKTVLQNGTVITAKTIY